MITLLSEALYLSLYLHRIFKFYFFFFLTFIFSVNVFFLGGGGEGTYFWLSFYESIEV